MPTRVLTVVVTGDITSYEAAMSKASVASGKAATAQEAAAARMKKAGATMQKVGSSLTKWVTLPTVAVGAAAVKMSLDFHRSMQEISTQAGASEKEVRRMTKAMMALGSSGRFAQGPQELSEALFDIESVGYRGAKAMRVLKAASDLATVGHADLEQTTSALAGVLKTGIRGAENMRKAIGFLNATIGAGKLHMEDLTAAIGTGFIGAASNLGLSLKGVGAALAELTSQGVPAQAAATRLRMTFMLMANPSDKAKDALKGIGIGAEDLAAAMRKSGSLIPALEILQEHLKGLTRIEQSQLLAKAFGGARSGTTIMQLIGKLEDLRVKEGQINETAGDFNKKLKQTNAEPAVQLAKAWSELRFELIKLGDVLLPKVVPLIKSIAGAASDILDAFAGLPKAAQEWILKLTIAAAALGPLLKAGGTLLKAYAALKGATLVTTATSVAGGAAGAGVGGAAGGGVLGGLAARLGITAKGGALIIPATILVSEFAVRPKVKQTIKETAGTGWLGKALEIATAGPEDLWKDIERHWENAFQGDKIMGKVKVELGRGFQEAMDALKVDAVAGIGAVNNDLRKGLRETNKAWGDMPKQWRAHTAQAMLMAIREIRQGMRMGTITTKRGRNEINQLLRQIHLIRGEDPIGIARGMANSFRKAHGVTEQGLKQWMNQLRAMPKGAREQAIDATLQILRAWAQGHPKIERQIKGLTDWQIRKFGATNKQLREGVTRHAATPIKEAYRDLAAGIGGALENIGTNTNRLLRVLGVKNLVEFQAIVYGPARSPQLRGEASAEAHHHGSGYARGGSVKRPMFMIGEEAPNHPEWVIATNPAYRRENLAYWMNAGHDLGVPGFAKGGLREPRIRPGFGHFMQPSLHKDYMVAMRLVAKAMAAGDRTYQAVVRNANRMDALHRPYVWGGGHGPVADPNGPWDCSGAISELLNGAGWHFPPMVSGGFEGWGEPGSGKVSILANGSHVYAVIGGRAFGTSGENPGGGAGWIDGYTYRPGFTVRHANLLNLNQVVFGKTGKGQHQVKGMARGGKIGIGQNFGVRFPETAWFIGDRKYTRWARQSFAPRPHGSYFVVNEAPPDVPANAATDGVTIWMGPMADRRTFYHEVGHLFARQHGTWGLGHERFADAYSLIASKLKIDPTWAYSAGMGLMKGERLLALRHWLGGFRRRGGVLTTSERSYRQHLLHDIARASAGYRPDRLSPWNKRFHTLVRTWNALDADARRYREDPTRHWLNAKLPQGWTAKRFDFIYPPAATHEWNPPVPARRGGVLLGGFRRRGGKIGQSETEAAAQRFRVPLWLLWGIAGAESTWGKGGSNLFGLLSAAEGVDVTAWGPAAMQAAKTIARLSHEFGGWGPAMHMYSSGTTTGGYGLGHVKDLYNQYPINWAKGPAAPKKYPPPRLAGAKAVALPPLGPTPLLPGAKGLPKRIREMLRSPGISWSGKVAVSEIALQQAEQNKDVAAQETAYRYQEELYKRNKHRLQKRLNEINRDLGKKGLSPKQRQHLLAQRAQVLSELGSVESSLAGVREGKASLAEGEGGETEADEALREAIEKQTEAEEERRQVEEELKVAQEELAKELKRQNDMAESAIATGSAEAWKALADILAGQFGPRINRSSQAAGTGTIGGVGRL